MAKKNKPEDQEVQLDGKFSEEVFGVEDAEAVEALSIKRMINAAVGPKLLQFSWLVGVGCDNNELRINAFGKIWVVEVKPLEE